MCDCIQTTDTTTNSNAGRHPLEIWAPNHDDRGGTWHVARARVTCHVSLCDCVSPRLGTLVVYCVFFAQRKSSLINEKQSTAITQNSLLS